MLIYGTWYGVSTNKLMLDGQLPKPVNRLAMRTPLHGELNVHEELESLQKQTKRSD